MCHGLSLEVWPEGSRIHLALLACGRKSSPSTACVSEGVQASTACLSPIGNALLFPFGTLLSPEILLAMTLKSFWVGVRMVLLLRCEVNTGKVSVEFSFGLKIWNSFAHLPLLQLQQGANTRAHSTRVPCSERSYFWLSNTFSSVFSRGPMRLQNSVTSNFWALVSSPVSRRWQYLSQVPHRQGLVWGLLIILKSRRSILSACFFRGVHMKGFVHAPSLNPYIDSWKSVVLLFPFHKWGHFSSRRWLTQDHHG